MGLIYKDGILYSGGGHILVNSQNEQLPQRNKIQVNGASLVDDSLNDKTILNISEPTSKADKVTNATNGDLAGLDSNGNLTDSGKKPSDFVEASGGESGNTLVTFTDPSADGTITSGSSLKTIIGLIKYKLSHITGGGHTIKDSNSASMNQRTNLQFNGANVSDDSTNDKTIITTSRVISQADYDLLPSSKNSDNIDYFIYDAPSSYTGVPQSMIGDAWVTSHSYTIGDYCIDGNVLYKCRTTHTSSASSKPPYASYWTAVSVTSELKEKDRYCNGVPKLSSNTNVLFSSRYSSDYIAWHAFDRSTSTEWAASGGTTNYIGYDFTTPKIVKFAYIYFGYCTYLQSTKVQYSDNNSTWTDASLSTSTTSGNQYTIPVLDQTAHRYWRIFITNSSSDNNNIKILQFL